VIVFLSAERDQRRKTMKQFRQFMNSTILTLISLVVIAPGVASAQGAEKDLIEAVWRGEALAVKQLLADGTSANAKNDEGVTALMLAAASGDTGITKLLLTHGAEVNARADKGWVTVINAAGGKVAHDEGIRDWTALMAAAALGRAEVIKLLLSNRAELEAKSTGPWSTGGWTALMLSAGYGRAEAVKQLLAGGADVKPKDSDGWTALIAAVPHGNIEMVKQLLAAGADVNARTDEGFTALISTASRGHVEIVKLLLDSGADVNAITNHGHTALKGATRPGHTEVVRLLLDRGALQDDALPAQNNDTLAGAAAQGRTRAVRELLASGAKVNAKNEHGVLPLIGAAAHGHAKVVQLLLDKGAQVNARDEHGSTALIAAAGHDHLDVVEILLAHGADVNAKNKNGITALRSAAGQGRAEVVKLLLSHNADINAKDRWGKTALMRAEERGHTNVVQLLKAQTAQPARSMPGLPADNVKRIESLISAWMVKHKAPALSVAIVTDNQLRWSNGYGVIDLENSVPARADTAYRLASISKSITATAVMQLVEKGRLDLDAPIQKYCPAYPEKQWKITARQLLVHFAGIRHNGPGESTSTKHYNSTTEALSSFKDDPLLHEPDIKYSYSTPGYTLLGCAIEGASGMAYLDYVRENIFKPARMIRTQADDVYAIIPNRARGYRNIPQVINAPLHDTSIKVPAGGLVSTADDLARFAIAVMEGSLVKKETLEQMWRRPKTRDGKESKYGFGWLIAERDGQKQISNDGGQAGTRTYLFLLPQKQFAIALMTNMERALCEELVPKIVDIVLREKE
jgi:ankyrin repeat protein